LLNADGQLSNGLIDRTGQHACADGYPTTNDRQHERILNGSGTILGAPKPGKEGSRFPHSQSDMELAYSSAHKITAQTILPKATPSTAPLAALKGSLSSTGSAIFDLSPFESNPVVVVGSCLRYPSSPPFS
jgi:hypothetical protein